MGPRQVGFATAAVLPHRGRNRTDRFPHPRQAVALDGFHRGPLAALLQGCVQAQGRAPPTAGRSC
eukprot:8140784-Alexandrium_andersonii.AAC.1